MASARSHLRQDNQVATRPAKSVPTAITLLLEAEATTAVADATLTW